MSDRKSMEEWLERAMKGPVTEEDHKAILEALPDDPEERREWLEQLRVAVVLSGDRIGAGIWSDRWAEVAKGNVGSAKKRPWWQSPWGLAAALAMMTLGAGTVLLLPIEIDLPDSLKGRGPVTVITMMEEREKSEMPMAPMVETLEMDRIETLELKALEGNSPVEKEVVEVIEEPVESLEDNMGEIVSLIPDEVSSVQDTSSLATLGLSGAASGATKLKRNSDSNLPSGYSRSRGGEAVRRQLAKNFAAAISADTSSSNEIYKGLPENDFILTEHDHRSTFSVDVDTASYANIRRFLQSGKLPPKDAVRVEEMVNYFDYELPTPTGAEPFSVETELSESPWASGHKLLRISLMGRVDEDRPKANLVFLLDVSGSMNSPDKLPLLKRAFRLMLNHLDAQDRVAIVAYAGHTGVVLDPTPVSDRHLIVEAMERLRSGGSTNGAGGIQLAYDLAMKHHMDLGVNRVILATDGDFNVGINNREDLLEFIADKRESGVELSVLGFGRGNIRDDIMEGLAQRGNGNYSYVDTLREARKALVTELNSNLVTIAKDVKLQLEFNPRVVKAYRQIGYENRALAHRDFEDDKKDAGEIGMGHRVTALYELKLQPTQGNKSLHKDPALRGNVHRVLSNEEAVGLTLNLRYKEPGGDKSRLITREVPLAGEPEMTSNDSQWASAVAWWGQLLRGSSHVSPSSLKEALAWARRARGEDPHGYRAEMLRLMEMHLDLLDTNPTSSDNLPRWEFR